MVKTRLHNDVTVTDSGDIFIDGARYEEIGTNYTLAGARIAVSKAQKKGLTYTFEEMSYLGKNPKTTERDFCVLRACEIERDPVIVLQKLEEYLDRQIDFYASVLEKYGNLGSPERIQIYRVKFDTLADIAHKLHELKQIRK